MSTHEPESGTDQAQQEKVSHRFQLIAGGAALLAIGVTAGVFGSKLYQKLKGPEALNPGAVALQLGEKCLHIHSPSTATTSLETRKELGDGNSCLVQKIGEKIVGVTINDNSLNGVSPNTYMVWQDTGNGPNTWSWSIIGQDGTKQLVTVRGDSYGPGQPGNSVQVCPEAGVCGLAPIAMGPIPGADELNDGLLREVNYLGTAWLNEQLQATTG